MKLDRSFHFDRKGLLYIHTRNLQYHFLQESRTKLSITKSGDAKSGDAKSGDAKNARDAEG